MSIISGINIYSPLHGYSSARQAYSPPTIQAQRAQCQDDVQLSLEALERYDAEKIKGSHPAVIDLDDGGTLIHIETKIRQNLEMTTEKISGVLNDEEIDPFFLVMRDNHVQVIGNEKASGLLENILNDNELVFRDQTQADLINETIRYTKLLLQLAHDSSTSANSDLTYDSLKSMGFPDPENNPDPEFADMALKFSGNRLSLALLDREERETLANGGSLA